MSKIKEMDKALMGYLALSHFRISDKKGLGTESNFYWYLPTQDNFILLVITLIICCFLCVHSISKAMSDIVFK